MMVVSTLEPAEKPQQPNRLSPEPALPDRVRPFWRAQALDGLLIVLFLGLTFLLGAFPLKLADIYWHLRTGDLIRQSGKVPQTDIFTFTREGTPWIDLHWIFQIGVSWLFERGGVRALNVAKCVLTCVAMLILLSARKREWSIPVMVLAWLPALLVLGGRIYVRPETLTLLYLSIFVAVIFRWDRFPLLAFLLPVVQIAWVNSQGLFVLGPVILGFGLIDAALRLGIFASDRRGWWKLILIASACTGLACLVNPYGIRGALYPIELARTMSDPIFSRNIAELTPIPVFIERSKGQAINNLPLMLHMLALVIGGLSFLLPLYWRIKIWLGGKGSPAGPNSPERAAAVGAGESATPVKKKRARSRAEKGKAARAEVTPAAEPAPGAPWGLSPFRLLLFAAFGFLSFQATRNSHQFGAVAGTVTAWNFAEWAAALRKRRQMVGGVRSSRWELLPRPVAFAAVGALVVLVGSGYFFRMTGEGRTIGLGEDALWFPHQAARFAGNEGMPTHFLSFHNGHAALFEYYHGPERKVYIDPRLEVAGADLFRRYVALENRISEDKAGWEAELAEMDRPVILSDHLNTFKVGATLLHSDHWRCVWFDAIAAVFVHDSFRAEVRSEAVDFAARHFQPGPAQQWRDRDELIAWSKAIPKYVALLGTAAGEKTQALAWLGLDCTRALLRQEPNSSEAWLNLGVIELFRELPPEPVARFRASFDPIYDLSSVRATYSLRRAAELAPGRSMMTNTLKIAYDVRLMHEPALALLGRIKPSPKKPTPAEYKRMMGPMPPTEWQNAGELDQVVTALLQSGRPQSAVELLEKAGAGAHPPWDMADRIATLRLHLGEPAAARAAWETAADPPEPAIREARIGTSYLAENDYETARKHYRLALEAKPDLFEALYCLAVLESDAGDAPAALALARKAVAAGPDEPSRAAARSIVSRVARFARATVELAGASAAAPGQGFAGDSP